MKSALWKAPVIAALLAGAMNVAPNADAQIVWIDQFDTYNLGPWAGQGGWDEWVGSSGVSGDIVSNFALTGTQSGFITGDDGVNAMGDDMVYDFAQLPGGRPGGGISNNGQWATTVNTYMPSGATGQGWVIMLNGYPNPSGDDYSASIIFFNGSGEVLDRSGNGGQGSRRPIRYDQWVPLTISVNLDDLRTDIFYAGERVKIGAVWAGDPMRNSIAAIDLYASEPGPNPVSEMYFDDSALEKVMGADAVALSMTPNPVIPGNNLRIDSDAPELANAPGLIFATFVNGVPLYRPILSFTYDNSGQFGLTAPVPSGTPAPVDIAFQVFTVGTGGLTTSNEMRCYFR